jgi:hypothetical protein
LAERAELHRGVVEFIAPSEYMVRPPQPPTYLFLIDVGYYSITSGMFHTCIQAIKDTLGDFPGDTRTRIGFITFDSTIHFYNLKVGFFFLSFFLLDFVRNSTLTLSFEMLFFSLRFLTHKCWW